MPVSWQTGKMCIRDRIGGIIIQSSMTTCCFTGHRRIPPEAVAPLRERLEAEIESLIRQGVRYFGAGGALGFDTLAAEAVLDLKAVYPFIRLIRCV